MIEHFWELLFMACHIIWLFYAERIGIQYIVRTYFCVAWIFCIRLYGIKYSYLYTINF